MIILLNGSSTVAGSAIAECIRKHEKSWRHLPLASLVAVAEKLGLDVGDDPDTLVQIASHCAEAAEEEGMQLVLSGEDIGPVLPTLRAEWGEELIAVHFGVTEDPRFDVSINPAAQSPKQIAEIVVKLLPS